MGSKKGPTNYDVGVGASTMPTTAGTAVFLNPSGHQFHRPTVQASYKNSANSVVYVGNQSSPNIELAPGQSITYSNTN